MSLLISLWGIFTALFPFVILLGVLVFIHELGHFMVARFCGVRVEVFSLGFGKKILKWKKGDTVYCISLFPLGGYVKMFGHDYTKEVQEKEKPVAFLHKKLWERSAIVLAGPLMNFFLAILLFAGLNMTVGETYIHPVVGEMNSEAPIAQAGLKYGDRLLSVEGTPIKTRKEALEIIFKNPEKELSIEVKSMEGEVRTLKVQSRKGQSTGRWGFVETGGVLDGLHFLAPVAMVGVADPKSPAGQAGIQTFDEIVSVNGQEIKDRTTLVYVLQPEKSLKSSFWKLKVKRGEPQEELSLTLKKPADYTSIGQLGLNSSELFISGLKEGGAGEKAGLQKGDFVDKVDGETVLSWSFLVDKIQGFKEGQKPLQLEVIREGEVQLLSLKPEKKTQIIRGVEHKEYMLGIMARAPYAPVGGYFTEKQKNPFKALAVGVDKTFYWSALIGVYIKKLIVGEVSRKTLGGAVSIGRAAYDSYSHGWDHFVRLMAILSVQLFLLNILPIPLFDGGHLMFYVIELFNGAPLSMRKMLIIQQVGVVFLLFLLIFTTFNDIHNWFFLW